MKIDNSSLIRAGALQPRDDVPKPKGPGQPGAQEAGPAARTHLSQHAADPGQDIDAARVAEIQDAIREGRLELNAERIADGLLANVRELLEQGDS